MIKKGPSFRYRSSW